MSIKTLIRSEEAIKAQKETWFCQINPPTKSKKRQKGRNLSWMKNKNPTMKTFFAGANSVICMCFKKLSKQFLFIRALSTGMSKAPETLDATTMFRECFNGLYPTMKTFSLVFGMVTTPSSKYFCSVYRCKQFYWNERFREY